MLLGAHRSWCSLCDVIINNNDKTKEKKQTIKYILIK